MMNVSPALKIYLASPLGFSPENDSYRNKIKQHLIQRGHEIFDPWSQEEAARRIKNALETEDQKERKHAISLAAAFTGAANADGIRWADVVLAVLDGAELDSGTAAEVGYGAGIGKKCFGLRTDFRDTGDLPGLPFNLQVLYFINQSGGTVFRRIEDICLS